MSSNKPPKGSLPRVIFIDGANFMNVFREVTKGYSYSLVEKRKNAFHLVPVIWYFISRGYVVRVVVNRFSLKPHSTLNAWILEELRQMELLKFPENEGEKEADDRFLLHQAEKYGAIILSNDKFCNHLEYRAAALKYRMSYERKKKRIDFENITNCFPIGCMYIFYGKKEQLIAEPSSRDYDNVEKSLKDIPFINSTNLRRLELLLLYLHCDLCAKFGVSLPDVASKYIDPNKEFPVNFRGFERIANHGYHPRLY